MPTQSAVGEHVRDAGLLCLQSLVGVVGLVVGVDLAESGVEPLYRPAPFQSSVQVVLALVFLGTVLAVTVGLAAIAAVSARRDGSGPATGRKHARKLLVSLSAAGLGTAVGGTLAFAIPGTFPVGAAYVLLGAVATAAVVAGLTVRVGGVDTALYALAGTVYVLGVTAATLRVSGGLVALLVPVVLVVTLLVARRRLRRVERLPRWLGVSLVVLALLVAVGAGTAAVAAPGVTVSVDAADGADFGDTEEVSIVRGDTARRAQVVDVGRVVVENRGPFARAVDVPSYDVCVPGEDGVVRLPARVVDRTERGSGSVASVRTPEVDADTTLRFDLVVDVTTADGATDDLVSQGTAPVRTARTCPDSVDGPGVVVVPDGG